MYASELNTNLGRFLPEEIKLFTITLPDPPHINRRAHTLPSLPLPLLIPIDIFQSSPQPSLPPPSLATSPKLCIMKRRSNNLEQSTGISWRNKKARSDCGRYGKRYPRAAVWAWRMIVFSPFLLPVYSSTLWNILAPLSPPFTPSPITYTYLFYGPHDDFMSRLTGFLGIDEQVAFPMKPGDASSKYLNGSFSYH